MCSFSKVMKIDQWRQYFRCYRTCWLNFCVRSAMRPLDWLLRTSRPKLLIIAVLLTIVVIIFNARRLREHILKSKDGDEEIVIVAGAQGRKGALQPSAFRIVSPGENIQVDDLEVHITTAVYYNNYPAASGFNLFLNGWAKSKTEMAFKCCLVRSHEGGAIVDDIFTEVKSYTYHIYDQWIVDMQNAEFSCSISKKQLEAMESANFTFVTFAKESCLNAPRTVMKIVYPQLMPKSVGICLKITYGYLNPEKMIEWFEYTRHLGVTRVFTYSHKVEAESMKVLQYYQSIGYLELMQIHPAVSQGGKERGYQRPRYEQQAWVDEVMASNDCKHRMSGFNYVIVMDMDEFILPQKQLTSYYDLLMTAEKEKPQVCSFSFDSHVLLPEWGVTRDSPLHICKYTQRTVQPNWDGGDKNTRWAFRPLMTYFAQNNLVHCRAPHSISSLRNDHYLLFHYRSCKPSWQGCKDRPYVNDTSALKYELVLVDRILALPLNNILSGHDKYISAMTEWKKNYKHDG